MGTSREAELDRRGVRLGGATAKTIGHHTMRREIFESLRRGEIQRIASPGGARAPPQLRLKNVTVEIINTVEMNVEIEVEFFNLMF